MGTVSRGWCGPCHHRCGLKIDFDGDKAIKVTGDKEHPLSRGFICARGRTILEHLYHKDRVNFPLKRKGERGKNEWIRISWDQALDEISEKLQHLFRPFLEVFLKSTFQLYQNSFQLFHR